MEKNKSCVRIRFSRIAWFLLVILLFAVPCGAEYVGAGETVDIDYAIVGDFLLVDFDGAANLLPGAYVDWGVLAYNGCTINIYNGQIGDYFYIMLFDGTPGPVVTVYGTDFALDGIPLDPSATQFSVDPHVGGVLTGTYENEDPIYLWFMSDVPIFLNSPAAEVTMTIDIKPGSEQNNINLKSKGVVPVAVLSTGNVDAAMIDLDTAKFAGAAPVHWKLEDVDGDGKDDLLLHFRTQELDLDQNSTEATLRAQLADDSIAIQSAGKANDGKIVSGTDEVQIVPAKKSKKNK